MLKEGKKYIYSLIIEDFLGLSLKNFKPTCSDNKVIIERLGKQLILKDSFFQMAENNYLTIESLPVQPLSKLNLSNYSIFSSCLEHEIPVLYGDTKLCMQDNCIELGLDIFGSCFFMLTRYEEVVKSDLDAHGRFPAKASLAYQEGFLERPIVDEYVEVLSHSIHHLWPDLPLKKPEFKQYVSCDVDWMNDNRTKWPTVLKTLGGDLLKRRSATSFLDTLKHFFLGINRFMTFDFIMDVCEKNQAELAFYFIARVEKEAIDGDYSINHETTTELMKQIASRGHEIGLHPSYGSYLTPAVFDEEKALLKKVLRESGLGHIQIVGGRQHYLRWKTPDTIRNWARANFKYESTLGYADHIGFRCGTGREYPFYDLDQDAPLKILIRPLMVMEVSMIEYMGLSHAEIRARSKRIKDQCRFYGTNFTLLWHNNFLAQREERETYEYLVSC